MSRKVYPNRLADANVGGERIRGRQPADPGLGAVATTLLHHDGHGQRALIGTRPAAAVSVVGRQVHQPHGLQRHLGGAPAVAGGHQRDAVIAPVVNQLLTVVQHNVGMAESRRTPPPRVRAQRVECPG